MYVSPVKEITKANLLLRYKRVNQFVIQKNKKDKSFKEILQREIKAYQAR